MNINQFNLKFSLIFCLFFYLFNSFLEAAPIMPISFWQNLRNCSALYVVPSEFNLTNTSATNMEFSVYLIGGGGGGSSGSAGSRGQIVQGNFVLQTNENIYAVAGGGGSGGSIISGGAGGSGYYGGGGGGFLNSYGGGGGGGSSVLLKNGVVLFSANGGAGGNGANGAALDGGGGGATATTGGSGGLSSSFPGFAGSFKLGGQAYCSGTNGLELVNGGRFGYGGKSNYDGGSFGSKGLTTGSILTGCSAAKGSGGFGSSGGNSSTSFVGSATQDYSNLVFTVSNLMGVGGIASTLGYSGSSGAVLLCKKKTADLFVGFPELFTSQLSTVVSTTALPVLGTSGTTQAVSVSGPGNPQLSINGGAWVTSGNISTGQTLALRQTSSASSSTSVDATVTLGQKTFYWRLTTLNPVSISFTDLINQPANISVSSTASVVNGSGSVFVSLVGTGNPEMSINSGAWVTSGSLSAGNSVVLRLTTPNAVSQKSVATLRCAVCADTTFAKWNVTTGSFNIPSFGSQSNLQLNVTATSVSGTITGTIPNSYSYPITLAGTGTQVSINSGAWTTTGSVKVGDSVQLRATTSSNQNTTLSASLQAINSFGYFYPTTGTSTYLAFTNLVNQARNVLVNSEVRTITANITSAPVSISAASGSPQFSINGGAWTTTGVLNNGDTFQVRMTTSSAKLTLVSVNITIAGSTTVWNVTTGNGPQIYVPNVSNALANSTVTSPNVVNTGSAGTLSVSSTASLAQFSTDGGTTWVTSGSIAANQTLLFRASYGNAGSLTKVELIVDGLSFDFWEINDGSVYDPILLMSSTNLTSGTASMTQIVSSSFDDAFQAISLPFNFTIADVQTKNWFVGSNTYINSVAGSTLYSGLSASVPAYPKFHLGSADNSYQRVFTRAGTNFYKILYEGTAATGGTVGAPNIVYEFTFFKPSGTKQYAQVVFGTHARNTGQFGVANTSTYYASGTTITANSSYVFEGNLQGTSWTIRSNTSVSGTGTSQ